MGLCFCVSRSKCDSIISFRNNNSESCLDGYVMSDRPHQRDKKLSPLCWEGCRVSGKLSIYYETERVLRQKSKEDGIGHRRPILAKHTAKAVGGLGSR